MTDDRIRAGVLSRILANPPDFYLGVKPQVIGLWLCPQNRNLRRLEEFLDAIQEVLAERHGSRSALEPAQIFHGFHLVAIINLPFVSSTSGMSWAIFLYQALQTSQVCKGSWQAQEPHQRHR